MLVLSRKAGERIFIGDQIAITIVRVGVGNVRIGIEAPPGMPIMRQELKDQLEQLPVSGHSDGTTEAQ